MPCSIAMLITRGNIELVFSWAKNIKRQEFHWGHHIVGIQSRVHCFPINMFWHRYVQLIDGSKPINAQVNIILGCPQTWLARKFLNQMEVSSWEKNIELNAGWRVNTILCEAFDYVSPFSIGLAMWWFKMSVAVLKQSWPCAGEDFFSVPAWW